MPGAGGLGARVIGFLVVAFLIVPILVVIPVSFTDTTYLSLPKDGLSLQHYANFIEDPKWRDSFLLSMATALASTVIAVPLGTLFAVSCWRLAGRTSELLRFVILLPIIVPGVVNAIGIYRQWAELGLVDTVLGVILVQVVVSTPYVVIVVSSALADFDPRLLQAAANLGARHWQALLWVIVPAIRVGIGAAAVLAFVTAWDETVVMLFITGLRVYLLPRALWDGVQENVDPTVAVTASLMIALTLLGVTVSMMAAARRKARDTKHKEPK
ncbi:ABC transporter permease [Acuticoccus sediminis]|uniref:ABC transporter permease n=1 Tax=Acuticoccus sediminis TaxID=2184697 RepID=UPI001CFC6D94|nr:ABC transporter permease [Acuticoccus sediminis]